MAIIYRHFDKLGRAKVISTRRVCCEIVCASRWCTVKANRNDPAHSVRSNELAPQQATEHWQAKVESVYDRRAHLLERQFTSTPAIPPGRLLVYDPSQSLSDGAAMVESASFSDVDNTPLWDTWIAYVKEEPQRPQGRAT
jgi:hypothetical protein